ncbi:uncharacterized protein LOC118995708 [Sturnira hondurensis]|uniref:uncharacterized protein LOC118995708 n=1 Tax=Sturnira hondurensis TaxID=192404 RepID=UPI0018792B19|nr:uncharacterized protein LOC118995708 [Sturnira hondurensis]
MEGQNVIYGRPLREREEPEVLPAFRSLSCPPAPSSRVLGQRKAKPRRPHLQRAAGAGGQSRERVRAARRRPLPGKQGEHQDSRGTGGAAAGFHRGAAEAPAGGPAGVCAAALHVPEPESERKGSECGGHEGRTWGYTGAAAGGGSPNKEVTSLKRSPTHLLQEPGAGMGEEAADTGVFNAPVINRFTRCASVRAEAYNPDEGDDAESRIIHPKTDDQKNRLQETWMESKCLKY